MTQVILDISANTHRNCVGKLDDLLDAIPRDHIHEIVVKTQLWSPYAPQGDNLRCEISQLTALISHANHRGFGASTSVFDYGAISMIRGCIDQMAFIKIACRPCLRWLADHIMPCSMPIYMSYDIRTESDAGTHMPGVKNLACVPLYPAPVEAYKGHGQYVSDHTVGREIWDSLDHGPGAEVPAIYECHYVLEHSVDNPDAGAFAKTPDELAEMLK